MNNEVHQHINAQVHGHVVGGDLTINHHQHTHHRHTHHHGPVHINTVVVQPGDSFALQAPSAPPAQQLGRRRKGGPQITPAQRELLTLMKPLPAPVRIQVLNFMRCEFGTGMVMELEPRELHQTRQQVLDARRSAGV